MDPQYVLGSTPQSLDTGVQDNPITIPDSDYESDTAMPDSQFSKKPQKSLQRLAEKKVLQDLMEAVEGYQAKANYCLGGSIPISETPTVYSSVAGPITTPPVSLRFDQGNGETTKITFPIEPANTQDDLAELLKTCTPATFGVGGRDVLDESYRKAGKLDSTDFSVDFHPYDFGVVDAIAQTLLPGIGKMMRSLNSAENNSEHWGVVAKMYKLNVSFLHIR